MQLRSRTLPKVQPPVMNSSNTNNSINRKTSANAYSGVSVQSQCVASNRHNPTTKQQSKSQHKSKSTAKKITLSIICTSNADFNTKIIISADLSNPNKIQNEIEQKMHNKFSPQSFSIINWSHRTQRQQMNDSLNNDEFFVWVKFKHQVSSSVITCEDIKNNDKCPFYVAVKEDYECNETNLKHLNEFTHFKDIYDKPLCRYMNKEKYKDDCYKYTRLQNGGNRIADRCHMEIYRHPPRGRNIGVSENNQPFLMNEANYDNLYVSDVYIPTEPDKQKWKWTKKDGFLHALIEEIVRNGFESNLIIKEDDKKQEINPTKGEGEEYTILSIVDEKMNCHRHKILDYPLNRGEMLSIILYTGCECNWYLSEDERNNNNDNNECKNKWKWMEYCLETAIKKLHEKEGGEYKIYTGLRTTNLMKNKDKGKFKTFVSASWKKRIAEDYMNNDNKNKNGGMIIEMNRSTDYGIVCCDVSWISKFHDECEVLIKRGTAIQLHVEDTQHNFQHIRGDIYDVGNCEISRSIGESLKMHFYQTDV